MNIITSFFGRHKITLIAGGVAIIFYFIVVQQEKKIRQLEKEQTQLINYAKAGDTQKKVYRNNWLRETQKTKVLDLSLRNARSLRSTEGLQWVEQFKGINKRLNNLDAAIESTASMVMSLELPLSDSITIINDVPTQAKFSEYRDSLNHVTNLILSDSSIINIKVKVPIYQVLYWERKKFLFLRIGRKEFNSDMSTTNPFVSLDHRVVKIQKK